ncbi:hypothetical protein A9P82_07140 [Arachidicoccus ginsenosidimutans]|uniref:DUF4998 domain-containing protein n=1 Tax=Arachidicoccus sp. BS20 TaxID=1850526 RepID=UPI0007F18735|nr:DUF4998 domain-containing protein [Arachidicoccus sp. BS20]ANI89084.1 hypothetical protein A9P82_07140 [Arachidicoccus sp. BS20]
MDAYKKYAAGGEISYTGKIDTAIIYSGHNRVLVYGLFSSDPKITSCTIYWDNRADSVVIPVTRTDGVDTLRTYITGLSEGTHSFEIVDYDKNRNASIGVFKTGKVYGDVYVQSLVNRTIASSALNTDLNTELSFANIDNSTGAFTTEIHYLSNEGDSLTMFVPVSTSDTVLNNHQYGSEVSYRTLYVPDTLCIDTLTTDFETYQPVSGSTWVDVTSSYVKNAGNSFQYSSWDGSRWGILADWTTNDAVKNASGYGGYELRSEGGVLSMEGGWGLPGVTNGKIYQTIVLPYAGQWRFSALIDVLGTAGDKYLVVNKGDSLPDITDLNSATGYFNFSASAEGATVNVDFNVTEPSSNITVGFVSTMPNTGSYYKITSVKLQYYIEKK